jgi:hypothetical protein
MASWLDDLLTPVGSLTAQGRENKAKMDALAAMQNSPVASKYAGLNLGQTPDNLINSVRDGHNAYASAVPPKNYDPTQERVNQAMGYPADPGQSPASTGVVSPGVPNGSTASDAWDYIKSMFSGDGPTLSGILRNGFGGGGGGGTSPVDAQPAGSNAYATTNLPGYGPAAVPESGADAASVTTPSVGDQLQQYKDFINQIYPKADMSETPGQLRADKFSENELKRTQLMAQLAMSSGILSQAGYGDVANGMAAAGGVYDKGFQRYQNALQDRGDREMSRRDAGYKDDLVRSQAAYKLYADQQTLGREEVEKKRKMYMDFLMKGAFPTPNSNDLIDPNSTPDEREKYRRSIEYLMSTGQYVPPDATDVRDK